MKITILSVICQIAQQPQSIWLWLFIITLVILIALAVGFFIFYSRKASQLEDYKNRIEAKPDEEAVADGAADLDSKIHDMETEVESMRSMLNAANASKANLENELEMAKDQIKMKDNQLKAMSEDFDKSHNLNPDPAPAQYYDNAGDDDKITRLLSQLNEANSLREQADSDARECKRLLIESQNENNRLKEDLSVVNHAYDQYQTEYQREKEAHEAAISHMRNECERNMQNLIEQHSRQVTERIGQKDEELSRMRTEYEKVIRDLRTDFERTVDRTQYECEQRVNDLVAKHGAEMDKAKRALRMEALRISDEYDKKMNEQAAKHSAEIQNLNAAHHAEITEKGTLLEQKERQLDLMQAKFQTEVHRITEEYEEKAAIAIAAKDAEISRISHEMDSAIKKLEKQASALYLQMQSARDEFLSCIIKRFDSMTPGISRLAADARAVDSGSMAAYLAENMLDAFGYAVSDFKNAVDTLDDSVSISRIQSKLRTSLAEKWADQNGWVAILAQLTAYARIPAMHDSLLACGIDTMLLARLEADANDILGFLDMSIIVPSILADDFDSASMESVSGRTIIDRINPDIMPRDYVGKIFDLVIPGISTPTSTKKPRVTYF